MNVVQVAGVDTNGKRGRIARTTFEKPVTPAGAFLDIDDGTGLDIGDGTVLGI